MLTKGLKVNNNSKNDYFALSDGESAIVIFCSGATKETALGYYQLTDSNKSKEKHFWVSKDGIRSHLGLPKTGENCPTKQIKEVLGQDAYYKPRFVFALLVKDGEDWTPKVWEQGPRVRDALEAYSNNLGQDAYGTPVKITRSGSGTQTTYSFFPAPKENVPENFRDIFSETIDLDSFYPSNREDILKAIFSKYDLYNEFVINPDALIKATDDVAALNDVKNSFFNRENSDGFSEL